MATWDELLAKVREEPIPEDEERWDAFVGPAAADKALRTIAHHAATLRRLQEQHERWEEDIKRRIRYHLRVLRAFAVRQREETGRASLALGSGDLRVTAARPSTRIEKGGGFAEWAGEYAKRTGLMRIVPDEAAVKKALADAGGGELSTPEGEIAPGIRRVDPPAGACSVTVHVDGFKAGISWDDDTLTVKEETP